MPRLPVAMLAPLLAAGAIALTPAAGAGEIDADLHDVLNHAAGDEVISTLVYLADQVDLDLLERDLAARGVAPLTRALRHEQVVIALQDLAIAAQADLLDQLEVMEAAKQVTRYQPFWIANCVRVDGPPAAIEAMAARADVAAVYLNYPIEGIVPEPAGPGGPPLERMIEPGVLAVRAPEVWARGITGNGILVATLDTGVDGAHPALAGRWRGLDPAYAGHPEWAFFDPVTNWDFPQDGGLHGTHTMGTVCGGAPGDQIGVAPGAEWISAAVIDRVSNTQTISDAILAFQWLVDPDGNPGTSGDVPHVCSNSWGIATPHNTRPYSTPCDDSFWSFLDACEAAGTVILFSAGNEGPEPDTLRRPGDRALSDYQTCAVGGIDANDAPNWTMFIGSSRGPTFCSSDGSAAIKPDINAPAVNVRSAFPGGNYGFLTGTSMASPHVNGVVALMLEACPALSVDEIKQVIYDTALDLGPPGKDNDYGYGLIDGYEAVDLAISLCSGVPLVEDGSYETPVQTPLAITLEARDYDGLPDPPGAVSFLIATLPDAGNTLSDPANGYVIGPGDLPYALIDNGNEVIYTPGPGYYGTDTFTFRANDGGTPPDGGDSEPGSISVLVLHDPPQVTTAVLPAGLRGDPYGPVQLSADDGQPALSWEVVIGTYAESDLGASLYAAGGVARGWHGDDESWAYALPFTFPFYGENYDTIYVCSNGFIDFAPGDTDPTNSAAELAQARRIAPLWDDLKSDAPRDIYIDASVPGRVTVRWDVLTYWGNHPCGFAATLFADGRVHFHYGPGNLEVAPTVGVSAGDGTHYMLASYNTLTELELANSLELTPPPDQLPDGILLTPAGALGGQPSEAGTYYPLFRVTDSLGRSDQRSLELQIYDLPTPPQAFDQIASTPVNTSIQLTLAADDDGLPDPPAALVYVIDQLPLAGTLSDPAGGDIDAVPYTLLGGGDTVIYTPANWIVGDDSFAFHANDGGVAPDGGDSNAALVTVTVDPPPAAQQYLFALDSSPGWAVEGAWEFGQPTGGGSFNGDPTAGYTGANVYGYNLDGDYANNLAQPAYLTTTAIDCRNLNDVELRFRRRLGVERRPFDRAAVEVSSDGVHWTQVWGNGVVNINDAAWLLVSYDISNVADDQPTVYLRWSLGPTDTSFTSFGWNIDDIEIWGWGVVLCPGDIDADGDVDLADVADLLDCAAGPDAGSPLPVCDRGDLDADGDLDLHDLADFQALYPGCGP